MKKAVVILRVLIVKRRLKEICSAFHISYKYCHAVSEETKKPSYNLMEKFLFMIPASYWFEEADKQFLFQIKEAMLDINEEQEK